MAIYKITEAGERELERMRSKLDGISGPLVVNTPRSISIGSNHARNTPPPLPESPILVTITSTGSNGATWKQLIPQNGTVVASVMPGGLTDEDFGPAFEVNGNTASTYAGSGTAGSHVWLFFKFDTDGNVVPCFEREHALRFGKIQSVAGCNAFAIVKWCNEAGTIIYDDTLVTVSPTKGGCDSVANGFCYNVGDVIAYLPDPENPTEGFQVGAYKTISLGYTCTTTSSANVPGLNEMRVYPGDFTLTTENCAGNTNVGKIYWNGNFIRQYAGIGSNFDHVKVLDFDAGSNKAIVGTEGVDYSELAVHISSGSTNANVPTIGGSPCNDESFPNFAKFSIRAKIGTAIASIDSVVCNEDGTITVNYSTMRVLVPI